jgi:hypothetical protein
MHLKGTGDILEKLCFWLLSHGNRAVGLHNESESASSVRLRKLKTVVTEARSFSGYVRKNKVNAGFRTRYEQVFYAVVYSGNPDGSRSLVYVGEGYGGNNARLKALEEAKSAALAYPEAVAWLKVVTDPEARG